jgi:hypothetical protein
MIIDSSTNALDAESLRGFHLSEYPNLVLDHPISMIEFSAATRQRSGSDHIEIRIQ